MSGKPRRCWLIKRKFLRVPSSTQPWATQCLALLQHLSPGKTVSERPGNIFVVWGKSHHPGHHEHGPLAGVPEDWGLSNSQTKKKETTLWNRKSGVLHIFFFFFFIMACVINFQRAPNSTSTVRLVTASRLVYGLVNCTHTQKNLAQLCGIHSTNWH